MESKKQIELLDLIRTRLINRKNSQLGICYILVYIGSEKLVSSKDSRFITNLLKENKPTSDNEYKEFFESEFWFDNDGYWWKPINEAPETRQIRIDYLTKLIGNIK